MCGLTGSLEFEPATPAETLGRQTRAMADTLVHRGPDSDGQWIDAKAGIAFGFRRLAIFDLSETGAQPMISHDVRYVMVYNGAVYNFPEMRAELTKKGHHFNGRSDTEVILAAIVEWVLRRRWPVSSACSPLPYGTGGSGRCTWFATGWGSSRGITANLAGI